MSNTCPRCLKTNVDIHTCTPTDFVREIEADRDAALAMVRELVGEIKKHELEYQHHTPNELLLKAEALNV